jgi:hypothetical protein
MTKLILLKNIIILILLFTSNIAAADIQRCYSLADITQGAARKGSMLIPMHIEHIRILNRLDVMDSNTTDESIQWYLDFSPTYPISKIISFKNKCAINQWVIPTEKLRFLSGKMI